MKISFHALLIPYPTSIHPSRLPVKFLRLVGASDIRTGSDTREAQLFSLLPISLEKFRMYIIHHGMMVLGWTKILADADQVAVCLAEVPKKTADFLLPFPESHHEAALGSSFGMQTLYFFQ
jgi:hypothetical protein